MRIDEYPLSGEHLARCLDTRKGMVVQDNLDFGIKKPLETIYLTTRSQLGPVAKTAEPTKKFIPPRG